MVWVGKRDERCILRRWKNESKRAGEKEWRRTSWDSRNEREREPKSQSCGNGHDFIASIFSLSPLSLSKGCSHKQDANTFDSLTVRTLFFEVSSIETHFSHHSFSFLRPCQPSYENKSSTEKERISLLIQHKSCFLRRLFLTLQSRIRDPVLF